MKEIDFENEHLFYSDDFDFSKTDDLAERFNKARIYGRHVNSINAEERAAKEHMSFTDLDDTVLSDEFGDTSAPNTITDNFKYFEEEYTSIFKVNKFHPNGDSRKKLKNTTISSRRAMNEDGSIKKTTGFLKTIHYTMLDVFDNPTLKIKIKKDISKIRTLESILEINTDAIDTSKFYLQHEKLLSKIDVEKLQDVAVIYLRFSQTPNYQTLEDWKHITSNKKLKSIINTMWDLIEFYQNKIKTTWEI